jgi:hypothetical protein
LAQTIEQRLIASVPVEAKKAILASVNASNSPTADDKRGGFHEEGGQWGTGLDGKVLVYPAVPGPAFKPGDKEATVDSGQAVDQEGKNNNLRTTDGKWHVHWRGDPSGRGPQLNQPPSTHKDGDLDRPADSFLPTNIVVGAANHRVYFYNANGVIANVSLSAFMDGVK